MQRLTRPREADSPITKPPTPLACWVPGPLLESCTVCMVGVSEGNSRNIGHIHAYNYVPFYGPPSGIPLRQRAVLHLGPQTESRNSLLHLRSTGTGAKGDASPTRSSIDGAFVESFIVPYNIAAHLVGVELEPAATALRRKLNRATICCTSVLQVLVQAHGMGRMTHPPLLYRPGGASTHWYHSTVDCVHGTRRPLPSHMWQISIARKSRWRRQTYWTGCL